MKEEDYGVIEDIILWNNVGCIPIDKTPQTKERGLKLIKEEYYELINSEDDEEELDALCDLIWVVVGHARCRGYNILGALEEVSDSNWSKFITALSEDIVDNELEYILEQRKQQGVTALKNNFLTIFKNKDGKIVKPSTFKEPNLKGFV